MMIKRRGSVCFVDERREERGEGRDGRKRVSDRRCGRAEEVEAWIEMYVYGDVVSTVPGYWVNNNIYNSLERLEIFGIGIEAFASKSECRVQPDILRLLSHIHTCTCITRHSAPNSFPQFSHQKLVHMCKTHRVVQEINHSLPG